MALEARAWCGGGRPRESPPCSHGCSAGLFLLPCGGLRKDPLACGGEPGLCHSAFTGPSPGPWASPDKVRSSLRPALSMMRAAKAVNSTWMMPTMTEARLLSWGDGPRWVSQRPRDSASR